MYYFGCNGGAGHSLHACVDGRLRYVARELAPVGFSPDKIDGTITPQWDRKQGAAALIQRNGHTAIAWQDYSVDSRPGSNSVFIVEGAHDFDEMVALLATAAPEVAKRQPCPIYLVALTATTQPR